MRVIAARLGLNALYASLIRHYVSYASNLGLLASLTLSHASLLLLEILNDRTLRGLCTSASLENAQ